ncbi:MAG: diacylglycerol kinase family protein [Negativicutes bacterium]|nr:diacylglycerol kinase family protein [Negativicutes bacterium]
MKAKNLRYSFIYAQQGIWYAVRTQRNMKIHLATAAMAAAFAWILGFSAIEFAILTVTIAAVLIAEMINSALEAVVDLVSPDVNPLAKLAKDMAAGAVLISALASLIVGYLLFWPRLFG